MNLKQASILFVEDEPFLRESMGAWLGQKAGSVFCAEHGEAAIKILTGSKVDLLLSDVRMPVMDGITLVKKVWESGWGHPAVILITGFSDLTLREAYEMGVDDIVEKPIDRDELLRALQHSLARPDELWSAAPAAAPATKLHTSFPSLPAALAEQRLAFGRRGFCIKSPCPLPEGPVAFAVEFKDDGRVLSGQGVVRWTAPQERQAGIEITVLDDASRNYVLDLVKRNAPIAFIPGSTGAKPIRSIKAA
jgi:CheY-like chemotaxis protein